MVYHELTIHVPMVPVVETKYWYPDNPIQVSLVADQLIVNAPFVVDQLVGLMSAGMPGAVVSR